MDAKTGQTNLPPELLEQFQRLERRLWRAETLAAGAGALAALCASFVLTYLSDRLWDTPVPLRVVLTLGGLALLGVFGSRWLALWVWKRRDIRSYARLVQKHYRQLGDRLLGIVELADETKRPANMSAALCKAAIRQVAADAERVDFTGAVNLRPTRTALLVAGGLAALVIVPWLLAPESGWNVFRRWAMPAGDVARYTFVEFAETPGRIVVPHAEPFSVSAGVRYRSFWRPDRARARFEQQTPIESGVAGDSVQFEIPGQTRAGALALELGDAFRSIGIEPVHRPFVKELTARIVLPEYLRYPEEEESIGNSSLALLEGSRVAFHGSGSRELAEVEARFGEAEAGPLKVAEGGFTTESRHLDGVSSVSFAVRDTLGLTNAAPMKVALKRRPDFAPRPDLLEIQSEMAILETDILMLKARAQDDFGVREVGVRWNVTAHSGDTNQPSRTHFNLETSLPDKKELTESFIFSPSVLDIPSDSTIELTAFARDYFPGREPSESMVYRIYVIDLVRHAEWIRQNLESVFAQLEEVTRNEEAIAGETRELTEMPAEQLEGEEAKREIGKQADKQAENARRLEALSREGARSLREAMRNSTFDEKTLQEWAQTLSQMQQLARDQMQQAAQALESAEAKNSGEERRPELEYALGEEEEAISKLQELQQRMNQGLDKLEAQTLAQRLRKLAEEEDDITGKLVATASEAIGLPPEKLSESLEQKHTDLAETQFETREKTRTIHGEISRFFERTQLEAYGEVSRDMEESEAVLKLESIGEMIAGNTTMKAMESLGEWSEQFREWADRLQPKSDEDGAGGEGQAGQSQQELMQLLISLLRVRADQNAVHQQTRLVEGDRETDPDHGEDARELAVRQAEIDRRMEKVREDNPVPVLDPLIGETKEHMKRAQEALSVAQTGEPAQRPQQNAMELLTDLVNLVNEQSQQQSQQQQQQGAQQQEMEFLMEMVEQEAARQQGMMPGDQPGMGPQEGDGRFQGRGPDGNPLKEGGPQGRRASRSTGTTRSLPAEFRDAFDRYFQGIEKTETP